MSEHIKGPWNIAARIFVDDAFGNTVCVPQAESPEGREARARLIAAAPELLEALKALLQYERVCDDGDPALTAAREVAVLAIDKAEGK